jgi:hypothetical protein
MYAYIQRLTWHGWERKISNAHRFQFALGDDCGITCFEQDPAFYLKFSNIIQRAIDDFRARRLSELEYLKVVAGIRKSVVCRQYDDVPASLRGNEDAALYGVLKPVTCH